MFLEIIEVDPEARRQILERFTAHAIPLTHHPLDLAVVDCFDQLLEYSVDVAAVRGGDSRHFPCRVSERVETLPGWSP
jgi:hypothetical protein